MFAKLYRLDNGNKSYILLKTNSNKRGYYKGLKIIPLDKEELTAILKEIVTIAKEQENENNKTTCIPNSNSVDNSDTD